MSTIRICMQQPSLAKYRIPVMRELASRSKFSLHVYYGTAKRLKNVEPSGFGATHLNTWFFPWPLELEWHPLPLGTISRKNFDVLILGWNTRHLSLLPYMLKARWAGIPVVIWGQGASKNEGAFRRWFRWTVSKLSSAIIVYNHSVADELVRSGHDRQRIFVAQNTVDQTETQAAREHWLSRPEELAEFRRVNNLGHGPHFIFLSRLELDNRTDVLIHAVHAMRAKHPGVRATIIGSGIAEASLKALVEKLGLTEHVKFPGAIYEDIKLAPWFMSADAFVYPTNVGLSLLHAFGFGLPAVVGDNIKAHNPEIEALRPGENGDVFKHNDPKDLACVLDELVSDRARLARLSRAAHTTATREFTLTRMVDGAEAAVRFAVAEPLLKRIAEATPEARIEAF
ncbi:MAG: glycosyltransferase family 4 protein [Phycisphaerales bacterium]|nr:glycosyltransferase family 4 protein [Phycisphaerales bacterium]